MAAESKVQTKIRTKLEKAGWYVVKIISCSKPGHPDQQAYAPSGGRIVHIECKAPGKEPTELQLHRHEELRKRGFEVIVADDIKHIEHLL